jgi:hypothetical protein
MYWKVEVYLLGFSHSALDRDDFSASPLEHFTRGKEHLVPIVKEGVELGASMDAVCLCRLCNPECPVLQPLV